MRLTSYGRTFLARTGAMTAAALLFIGGIILELDLAYTIGLNQQLFNVLFIAIVLPICISLISVWFYDETDRKTAGRVQGECKG